MAGISVDEPRGYPTSKTSVYAKYEAREIAQFKKKQAAKKAKERAAREARKAQRDARRDSVELGRPRGADRDVQKFQQLGKRTQEQRLARRRAIILKGTSDEKKWRSENKKPKSVIPDSESRASLKRAGAARAKRVANSNSGSLVVVSDLGLEGKAGSANALFAIPTYARSATKSFSEGDYGQAMADASVATGSALKELAPHSSLVSKEAAKAFSDGAGAAALANDVLQAGYEFYKGHTADGADHLANAVISGVSMAPGPVGHVGKVGTVLDLGMNVGGGDQFIQDGLAGEANAKYKQIDDNGRMQARLMAKQSPEYIRSHRKEAAEALRYQKDQAIKNYQDEAEFNKAYEELVYIRESLARTY